MADITDRSVGLADLAARAQAAPQGRPRRLVRWRKLVEFPGYSISSDGRVQSSKVWRGHAGSRFLTPRKNLHRKGYLTGLTVVLFKGNKRYTRLISHLVLTAFIGTRPKGQEACHWDGDPSNNNVNNLRWDTHANNMLDTVRHGRTTAKMLEGEVERLRDLRAAGVSFREIKKWLGLTVERTTMSMAASGANWSHLHG